MQIIMPRASQEMGRCKDLQVHVAKDDRIVGDAQSSLTTFYVLQD